MITPNSNPSLETHESHVDYYSDFKTCSQRKKTKKVKHQSLRRLRIEKNLTQQELSQLLRLTRSQYQRLESKSAEKFTVGEIEMIAKALSVSAEEVIRKFSHNDEASIVKGFLSQAAFVIHVSEKIKISSFCDKPREYFVGTMSLSPKACLENANSPKANQVYYAVLKGEVLVVVDRVKKYVLKKEEYIMLDNVCDYEIYNPHSLYTAELMITTTPSFTVS